MSDDIVIRPARAEDIDAVAELAELAWQPVFAEFRRRLGDDLDRRLRPQAEGLKDKQVREAFAHHPENMIVTETGGRVVAFATFYLTDADKKIGEIANNAVHPDFQGRGIARKQYERIFDELRQRGMEYVRVTTGLDEAHAPARRAYEAVGFDRELPSVTYYREL